MRERLNIASLIALGAAAMSGMPQGLPDIAARGNAPGESRASISAKADTQKSTPQRLAQLDQQVPMSPWARRGKNGKRTPGGGWSVAQDRRMARKRRNVAKNRRAHR